MQRVVAVGAIGWSDAEAQPDLQRRPADDETFWIFDPIDGAYHYLQGLPLWSSSLALISGGRAVFAVVATALPPFGYGDFAEHEQARALLGAVAERVFVVRQMASASLHLAYVAAGRLDAYWEVGRDVHDWAAGALLVRESGAQITDLTGALRTVLRDGAR
ncbi:MAG TPA: inositol monophosphatase family protein [Candidatus Limnocylindria bacterium]|nr:inositol monophosphatase family protein [Candidatus Limnocylindria bacterium]